MRILVFGKTGQVGAGLGRSLQPLGDVRVLGRAEVDLADLAAITRTVRAERPDVIVNAAAYTAVDRAESEPELAMTVNGQAPDAMARAAADIGALLIHYSTDYVFDGSARTPYPEDAPTCPLSVYGRTKLAGEEAVRAAGGTHLILRTSWVYSLHGHNFLKTVLRLARERDELRIVDDQIGSPTCAGALAAGTAALIARVQRQGGLQAGQAGIYQMTCAGATSWYGFAKKILEAAHLDNTVRVVPIKTPEYPTPAARPAYSVLSNEKLARVFDVRLPDWEEGLRQCLAEGGLAIRG